MRQSTINWGLTLFMRKMVEVGCGWAASLSLFFIMGLTLVDVLGRKLVDRSVPGALEVIEMLMVVVIFAALPLVSLRAEHVTFDSLDAYLPKWARWFQAKFMNLLAMAVFIGLGYLMLRKGIQIADQNETSAQLKIAKAPFIYAMALFLWLCAYVHAQLLFDKEQQDSEVSAL
jgi:TRAP-type transport system small permease protein